MRLRTLPHLGAADVGMTVLWTPPRRENLEVDVTMVMIGARRDKGQAVEGEGV